MEIVLLIARLLLAVVFGVAGIAKAADLAGSRRAIAGFGIPERLASPLGLGLPFTEILIAVALIPVESAWLGAIAASALLLIFCIGIAVNLARGRTPDCRCFGQLHSKPVGLSTLMRNLMLAAAAALVVVLGKENPGLSALSWSRELKTAEVISLALSVSSIVLTIYAIIFVKRLLDQQAKLLDGTEAIRNALNEEGELAVVTRKEALLPRDGLPIGTVAPKFSLATITGEETALDDLLGYGRPVLLVFAGPNCWGCKLLLPAVRVWQRDYDDRLTVAVLSNRNIEESQNKMAKYEITNLLIDEDSSVADDYQAKWTPAAVLIHPDGKIASQNTYGDSAIREWLRNLISSGQVELSSSNGNRARGHIPQIALQYSVREIGELAPRFSLPDLFGKMVGMEDFLGSPTLLLFWHPRCSICATLLDDLRRWEEHSSKGAPELVFVACGEVEDIRLVNKDFKSLTLLDPTFDVGPLFGTRVTPSAILIDGYGRVASSVAMGSENVRALVGLPKAELPVALQI